MAHVRIFTLSSNFLHLYIRHNQRVKHLEIYVPLYVILELVRVFARTEEHYCLRYRLDAMVCHCSNHTVTYSDNEYSALN